MGHQQSTVGQPNVRLHAPETVLQPVSQCCGAVVTVRVRPTKKAGRSGGENGDSSPPQSQTVTKTTSHLSTNDSDAERHVKADRGSNPSLLIPRNSSKGRPVLTAQPACGQCG